VVPRYPLDEDSVLFIMGQSVSVPSRIVELSQEGCLILTAKPATVRPRLPVEIHFKVRGASFRFRGVVQLVIESNALAIQFVNMVPRHMEALAEVLREMEAAAAVRAQAAKRLATERETLKSEAENALTPEISRTAELAVAPIEDTTQKPAPAVTGRERRQCMRQQVDDSAEIHLVKIRSILKGRILDLSLGGCRIRTEERFPVGIYTRVETEFRLEGLPFRLGGVIQVIHDRNTVGIRFLDLSERKREQVQDLMNEIEELRAAQAQPGSESRN